MLELITSGIMMFSMLPGGTGAHATEATTLISPVKSSVKELAIVDDMALVAPQGDLKTTREKVREYFQDTPILISIARCESGFRQTDDNGDPIIGKVNKSDIGVMQINTFYHGEEAKRLGYDLRTTEGNMAFAKHLYERDGTDPWQSSSACWMEAIAQK